MRVTKLAACAGLAIAVGLLSGCGPSVEERQTIENLNRHNRILDLGGVVKSVELSEGGERGVAEFEADIFDRETDKLIGRVRAHRVEGFGTRIQWVRMYNEDGELEPVRGGGGRRGGWRGGGDGDGDREAFRERMRERRERGE